MNYNHLKNVQNRFVKEILMGIGKLLLLYLEEKNGKALSSYWFVTLAEIKSIFYIVKHFPDRKDETVTNAIIEMLNKYPKELV